MIIHKNYYFVLLTRSNHIFYIITKFFYILNMSLTRIILIDSDRCITNTTFILLQRRCAIESYPFMDEYKYESRPDSRTKYNTYPIE